MNYSFDLNQKNRIDPGLVRNFLRDADNDKNRKKYSNFFHIVYAVICAALIYFAADGVGPLESLVICVAPAMCVFTFLYAHISVKAIPVALPPVFLLIRLALTGFKDSFYDITSVLFIYCLCLLSAAVITKAVISGHTKNSVMISLAVTYGLILVCQIAFVFISVKGSFSAGMLREYIDEYFNLLLAKSTEAAATDEGYEMLKTLGMTEQIPSKEDFAKYISSYIGTVLEVVKMCLPAIFALTCMFYGFVSVAVFSVVAKVFRINVFVSIMDNFWTYRPGVITANIYDLLFLAILVGMFVPFPKTFSACLINFLLILTPVMCISGLRGIYEFFMKRIKNGLASALITAVVVFAVSMFTGAFIFFILGSAGIFFITAKNREEKERFSAKFAEDRETYIRLYKDSHKEDNKENDK